ncbi:MAG: SPASM domain-containing protein [Lachnospiraceae bacterium]
MITCKRGALHLQIMRDGYVRPCEFMVNPNDAHLYGSLKEKSLYDIYHGKIAEDLRSVIEDGKNFEYCRKDVCRNIASGDTEKFITEIDSIPDYPWELNLAYDTTCNYHCKSCIFHKFPPVDEDTITLIEERLAPALPYAKHIIANGCGELFASNSIMKILQEWNPVWPDEECSVELQTNGSLCDERHWEKIKNIDRFYLDVEITIMSFDERTYQYLSGTELSINRIIDNLHFVRQLREKNIINHLELATVVQERNFREMPEFVGRCIHEFGADLVRFKGFEPWGAMDKNIEWFFNVRNPLHPYYQEYVEMMKNPIFKDPKVLNWMGHSDSLQGEIPAKANYEVLKKWHMSENPIERIKQILIENQSNGIILYGISEMAELLYKELSISNIKIIAIMDKYTTVERWQGLPVIRPIKSNVIDLKAMLLITLFNKYVYIKEDLIKEGFNGRFLELQNIL